MVMRFFHAYMDPNTFEDITDLKLIAKNYLRTWFFIDFIAIIPFNAMIGEGNEIKLIRILRLPKFM